LVLRSRDLSLLFTPLSALRWQLFSCLAQDGHVLIKTTLNGLNRLSKPRRISENLLIKANYLKVSKKVRKQICLFPCSLLNPLSHKSTQVAVLLLRPENKIAGHTEEFWIANLYLVAQKGLTLCHNSKRSLVYIPHKS